MRGYKCKVLKQTDDIENKLLSACSSRPENIFHQNPGSEQYFPPTAFQISARIQDMWYSPCSTLLWLRMHEVFRTGITTMNTVPDVVVSYRKVGKLNNIYPSALATLSSHTIVSLKNEPCMAKLHYVSCVIPNV